MFRYLFVLTVSTTVTVLCSPESGDSYTVRGEGIRMTISDSGHITGVANTAGSWAKSLDGCSLLENCVPTSAVRAQNISGAGVQFTRGFVSDDAKHRCTVVDRFTPERSSIRWEVEIEGDSLPWSTGIITSVKLTDTTAARFWTTWGNPEQTTPKDPGELPAAWHNPFVSKPFRNMHLIYGGHFGKGAGFAVPVFSVLYPGERTGVSLAMSPEDPLLDVHLVTTRDGEIRVIRNFNRVERGRTISFTMHLFLHEADWRPVMAFMMAMYPQYFTPPAKNALDICGLGAYSSYEGDLDAEKFKRMGGIVNWKASFDFSYMGMFLPPVKSDTTRWERFDVNSEGELIVGQRTTTSIQQMRAYATKMKNYGFSTLNYFNVTEFGGVSKYAKAVVYPEPNFSHQDTGWTNPSAFLYRNFPHAILFGALEHVAWHKITPDQYMYPPVSFHDAPYWSWGGAIATDVGDSSYAAFLLGQAQLHVEKFPDAQGICIDRFDWFNEYNWRADDGKTWVGGRPVRSLLNSYRSFIPRLSTIIHAAGKVIFCNPHMNRLELMEYVDGIYNEFGYIGHNLNLSAFLTADKPLICWTPDTSTVMKSPDTFFQTLIVMGAFPTAPFPGNDHCIGPDPAVEKYYLDYGPMFNHLHGRKWVMLPGLVEVDGNRALANVFNVGRKVIVPLVLGTDGSAMVLLRHCAQMGITDTVSVEILYPGQSMGSRSRGNVQSDELRLNIPLRRGCAFLVITPG